MGTQRSKRGEWLTPNRSFTLVEMLVIIAIMCILSAMLMPSLMKALGSARHVECTNHMKQMVVTGNFYADDNNHFLIPGYWGTGAKGLGGWYNYTALYLERNQAMGSQRKGMYFCSANRKYFGSPPITNYAWNCNAGWIDLLPGIRSPRRNEISVPSKFFLIADSGCSALGSKPYDEYCRYALGLDIFEIDKPQTGSYALPDCHNEGNNLGFLDNHVSFIPYGETRKEYAQVKYGVLSHF